jgi:hypothetical protein
MKQEILKAISDLEKKIIDYKFKAKTKTRFAINLFLDELAIVKNAIEREEK